MPGLLLEIVMFLLPLVEESNVSLLLKLVLIISTIQLLFSEPSTHLYSPLLGYVHNLL